MNTVIHRADSRGGADYDWLSTRHSFSFAHWYDGERMGFGALRVLNDDQVAPERGFGMHAHKNMEIITIVTNGEITHTDSLGNTFTVRAGDVQVMSAGTGVEHSERNASTTEALEFFQIWIEPNVQESMPRYSQKSFELNQATPRSTTIVAPDESFGGLVIQQDAYITYVSMNEDTATAYALKNAAHGSYVFVVSGSVVINGIELSARDAVGISEVSEVEIKAETAARLLIIEVPLLN